jgi:hypothetical protein
MSHLSRMRKQAFLPLLSLAVLGGPAFGEGVDGNSAIRGMVDGSPLVIRTSSQFGGAIYSLTWKGKEFINAHDHGRLLQSAELLYGDGDGGCDNPTEAGSSKDDKGPTSTSKLLTLTASGNVLATATQMAYWLAPGQSDGHCTPIVKTKLSNQILYKRVQIGYAGMPNVIEYSTTFVVKGSNTAGAAFGTTAYMPPSFSNFWTYNPETSYLYSLSAGSPGDHQQPVPLIMATTDNDFAMGVYSPSLPQPGYPNDGYGRYSFLNTKTSNANGSTNDAVKWNCAFREPANPAKDSYGFRCFLIVGKLSEVETTMTQLAKYLASPGSK